MTTDVTSLALETAPPPVKARSRPLYGLANLGVVVVLALGSWYLLADPTLSPWKLYPLPFNAALFWAILFGVYIGFNTEFWGIDRIRQPLRGFVIICATTVFAVLVTWLLANALGHFYPAFAGARDGGLGYFDGALFVLFGFATWVMVVLNWMHWPWPQLGLKQPLIGLCEIAFMMVPTLAPYLVFGLPAVSGSAATPLMSVDTVLGWFYSIVVAVILTGQTMDNWPWRLFGGGGRTALASLIGNVLVGTTIYFLMVQLAQALIGSATVDELGGAINQYPALGLVVPQSLPSPSNRGIGTRLSRMKAPHWKCRQEGSLHVMLRGSGKPRLVYPGARFARDEPRTPVAMS